MRPIPVDVPLDSRLVKVHLGARLVPTATPAIAIAEWAYTAELIGACRRQHRQLAVYLSMFLDEGYRRLKRTSGPAVRAGASPGAGRPRTVRPGVFDDGSHVACGGPPG